MKIEEQIKIIQGQINRIRQILELTPESLLVESDDNSIAIKQLGAVINLSTDSFVNSKISPISSDIETLKINTNLNIDKLKNDTNESIDKLKNDTDLKIETLENNTNTIIKTLEDNTDEKIKDIKKVIPTQATQDNQVADKSFVNSSIMNMASRFITPTENGNTQWDSLNSLNNGVWYYQGKLTQPTNNDYAIYTNTDNSTWRATFDSVQWNAQYKVNNTPFTSSQIQAINSGITMDIVHRAKTAYNPDNPPPTPTQQGVSIKTLTINMSGSGIVKEILNIINSGGAILSVDYIPTTTIELKAYFANATTTIATPLVLGSFTVFRSDQTYRLTINRYTGTQVVFSTVPYPTYGEANGGYFQAVITASGDPVTTVGSNTKGYLIPPSHCGGTTTTVQIRATTTTGSDINTGTLKILYLI